MRPNQVTAEHRNRGAKSEPRDRLAWGVLIATAIVLVIEPIQSADLWWDLSRGRQVLQGSISPSRELLAVSDQREADWLSGLPAILAYSAVGIWGLFLVKGITICIAIVSLIGRPRCDLRLLVIVVGMLAARGVWDVTAKTADVVMFMVSRQLAANWLLQPTKRRAALLAATQLLWANFGPLSVFGLLSVAASAADSAVLRRSWRDWLPPFLLAGAAACCTPRGIGTIWDSLCLAVPSIVSDGATLLAVAWEPSWAVDWDWRFGIWVAISVAGWFIQWHRPKSPGQTLLFAAVQAMGWAGRQHTAFAVLATAILISESWPDRCPVWLPRFPLSWQRSIVLAGVSILLAANCCLDWPSLPQRAGVLLRPQIDPSLLAESMHGLDLTGSAHCTDTLAAGMLCWIKPSGPRPWDVPSRALLAGRIRDLALLNDDLQQGHRDPYQRSDGSWGGWWSVLHRRETELIVTDARNLRLLRALEPSVWKPLSLDSSVLPFGQSGDKLVSVRIVEVLRQRQFVNTGTWTYRPYDVETDVRLARVLQAFSLPIAALRVVHAARRVHDDKVLRLEMASCQLELGYHERMVMGQASDWRMVAFRSLVPERDVDIQSMATLGRSDLRTFRPPAWLQRALVEYLAGNLGQARIEAHGDSAQAIYVEMILAFEAGQTDEAARFSDRLRRQHPDHPLTLVYRDVVAE